MAYNLGGVNPYEAGNVPITNDRYMDYFIKQQQHQQALKQAYQRNLAEQSSKLTPTGVDTKVIDGHSDIQDFNNAKNDWLQHSMANAKVLSNSNNPNFQKAYLENQQLYNKSLDILDRSKQKMQNLPKYADLALKNTGVDMQDDYHKASLPLSHPQYQEFDVSKILTPQPFDIVADQKNTRNLPQFKEQQKDITLGNTDMNEFLADGKTTNPNFLKQSVTKTYGHTKEQVQGIATLGATEYNTNPKLKNFIDNKLAQQVATDPTLFKHYDDVLFNNTGKHMDLDPTHLQNTKGHQDLAAAFKLDNTVLPDRTQTDKPIYNEIQKEKYNRAAQDKITMKHIRYAKEVTGSDPLIPITNLTNAIKTGDPNIISQHLQPFAIHNTTGTAGDLIGINPETSVEKLPNGNIALHYTTKQTTGKGHAMGMQKTLEINPNDANMTSKIAALNTELLGKNVATDKKVQNLLNVPAPKQKTLTWAERQKQKK